MASSASDGGAFRECMACFVNPFTQLYSFNKQINSQIKRKVQQLPILSERQRDIRLRQTELHLDHLEEQYLCCICLRQGDYRDTDLEAVKESQEAERKALESKLTYKLEQGTKTVVMGTAKGIAGGTLTVVDGVVDMGKGVVKVTEVATDGGIGVFKRVVQTVGGIVGIGGADSGGDGAAAEGGGGANTKSGTNASTDGSSNHHNHANRREHDGDDDDAVVGIDPEAERRHALRKTTAASVRRNAADDREMVVLDNTNKAMSLMRGYSPGSVRERSSAVSPPSVNGGVSPTGSAHAKGEGGGLSRTSSNVNGSSEQKKKVSFLDEELDEAARKKKAKEEKEAEKERLLHIKAVSSYHRDKGLVRIQGRAEEDMLSAFYQKPIRGFLCHECHAAAKFRRERLHQEIAEIIERGKRPFVTANKNGAPTNASKNSISNSIAAKRKSSNAAQLFSPDGSPLPVEQMTASTANNAAHHRIDGVPSACLSREDILLLRRTVHCAACIRRDATYFHPQFYTFVCQFCCCRDRSYREMAWCINNEPMPSNVHHFLEGFARLTRKQLAIKKAREMEERLQEKRDRRGGGGGTLNLLSPQSPDPTAHARKKDAKKIERERRRERRAAKALQREAGEDDDDENDNASTSSSSSDGSDTDSSSSAPSNSKSLSLFPQCPADLFKAQDVFLKQSRLAKSSDVHFFTKPDFTEMMTPPPPAVVGATTSSAPPLQTKVSSSSSSLLPATVTAATASLIPPALLAAKAKAYKGFNQMRTLFENVSLDIKPLINNKVGGGDAADEGEAAEGTTTTCTSSANNSWMRQATSASTTLFAQDGHGGREGHRHHLSRHVSIAAKRAAQLDLFSDAASLFVDEFEEKEDEQNKKSQADASSFFTSDPPLTPITAISASIGGDGSAANMLKSRGAAVPPALQSPNSRKNFGGNAHNNNTKGNSNSNAILSGVVVCGASDSANEYFPEPTSPFSFGNDAMNNQATNGANKKAASMQGSASHNAIDAFFNPSSFATYNNNTNEGSVNDASFASGGGLRASSLQRSMSVGGGGHHYGSSSHLSTNWQRALTKGQIELRMHQVHSTVVKKRGGGEEGSVGASSGAPTATSTPEKTLTALSSSSPSPATEASSAPSLKKFEEVLTSPQNTTTAAVVVAVAATAAAVAVDAAVHKEDTNSAVPFPTAAVSPSAWSVSTTTTTAENLATTMQDHPIETQQQQHHSPSPLMRDETFAAAAAPAPRTTDRPATDNKNNDTDDNSSHPQHASSVEEEKEEGGVHTNEAHLDEGTDSVAHPATVSVISTSATSTHAVEAAVGATHEEGPQVAVTMMMTDATVGRGETDGEEVMFQEEEVEKEEENEAEVALQLNQAVAAEAAAGEKDVDAATAVPNTVGDQNDEEKSFNVVAAEGTPHDDGVDNAPTAGEESKASAAQQEPTQQEKEQEENTEAAVKAVDEQEKKDEGEAENTDGTVANAIDEEQQQGNETMRTPLEANTADDNQQQQQQQSSLSSSSSSSYASSPPSSRVSGSGSGGDGRREGGGGGYSGGCDSDSVLQQQRHSLAHQHQRAQEQRHFGHEGGAEEGEKEAQHHRQILNPFGDAGDGINYYGEAHTTNTNHHEHYALNEKDQDEARDYDSHHGQHLANEENDYYSTPAKTIRKEKKKKEEDRRVGGRNVNPFGSDGGSSENDDGNDNDNDLAGSSSSSSVPSSNRHHQFPQQHHQHPHNGVGAERPMGTNPSANALDDDDYFVAPRHHENEHTNQEDGRGGQNEHNPFFGGGGGDEGMAHATADGDKEDGEQQHDGEGYTM